jgi:hypothetical protein
MKKFLVAAALVAGGASLLAQPAIELRGVLLEGGAVRLSLLDRSSDTSRWVEVGQTFSGYKVTGYDAASETATLNKDGSVLRVSLAGMKIKPADPLAMIPTRTREEIQKAVLNNLRQISAAADQYYLEHGGNTVPLAELVGPTKYIKQLNPVDGESYAGMQLKSGVPVSVTTAQGISVSYAP